MPVGQALTTTRLRFGAGAAAGAGVGAAAGAATVAGSGETTSCTRATISSAVVAARSDATNSGRTSARARAVSSVRWSASPCAGAAMRKTSVAGPSGAPKSTAGESRAKPREASVTASERQWGMAIPPGSPVAACASRAMASACSASALVARPASATSAASRRTTASLSGPRETSRATRSRVISSGMRTIPLGSTGVPAGGRDRVGSGAGAGGPGGDPNCWTVHLGRGGDGGSGERRAGRSVRDRGAQPLGGRLPGQVGEQVAGEAAVARADGAADGDPRRLRRPHALGGREDRAVGAEGQQHLGDPALVQGADGGQRRVRVGEHLGLGHAGQLGQLLG